MDDLNGHATRSRILGNLLGKNGCSDASDDIYRAPLEVHDFDVDVDVDVYF